MEGDVRGGGKGVAKMTKGKESRDEISSEPDFGAGWDAFNNDRGTGGVANLSGDDY